MAHIKINQPNSYATSADYYTGISPSIVTGAVGGHYTTLTAATDSVYSIGAVDPTSSITLKGPNADIDLNGVSLRAFIQRVEERLAILKPDTRLESEWAELKALGDQYRALEKEINEKMKTWDILKTDDN
jgi:hypothetical protein